jgi:hypothetical protein
MSVIQTEYARGYWEYFQMYDEIIRKTGQNCFQKEVHTKFRQEHLKEVDQ